MAQGQVSKANCDKRRRENESEEQRKARSKSHREWEKRNRAKINQYRRECRARACEIIKKHHEDMKDDPERLTTEFMKSIVNVKCDDYDA